MLDAAVAQTRSRVGVAHRTGDAEQIAEANRDHAAAKLAAYIRKTVDSAPPLTVEQRCRLAALLSGGTDAA